MADTRFTRSALKRLGKNLRESRGETLEDLEHLQAYRTSHKAAIAEVFDVLCGARDRQFRKSIVTFRIKRIQSILSKLSREQGMELGRMWDIGGCRCILKKDAEVYRLAEYLGKVLEVRATNDYIATPKKDGYRSLHLYVRLSSESRVIEVQLRSEEQHNWATLVEISDLVFDSRLKEFEGDQNLREFHYLLSKLQLTPVEKTRVLAIADQYGYFSKLSRIFARNYLEVRKQWHAIERQKRDYFLIATRVDMVPTITAFDDYSAAEEAYFRQSLEDTESNIVLTHLENPKYREISTAYSNYILTVHAVLDTLLSLYDSVAIGHLENGRVLQFLRYYKRRVHLVESHVSNLKSELVVARKIVPQRTILYKSKKEVRHDWIKDIEHQVKALSRKTARLSKSVQKHIPRGALGRTTLRVGLWWIHNFKAKFRY